MSDLLEQLGMSQEELQERVVTQTVERLLNSECVTYDDDGEPCARTLESKFQAEVRKAISAKIDEKIQELLQTHILPKAETFIENVTLQERTKWGTNVGEPIAFVDYLVKRGEQFLKEVVNCDGLSKDEVSYSSDFRGKQTRLAWMIHKHLHYTIESAVKAALTGGAASLADAIVETTKIKMAEISKSLQIGVRVS